MVPDKPTKPGPYLARSASDKTDDWLFWYIAGPDRRTNYLTELGGVRAVTCAFVTCEQAKRLAVAWNGEDK